MEILLKAAVTYLPMAFWIDSARNAAVWGFYGVIDQWVQRFELRLLFAHEEREFSLRFREAGMRDHALYGEFALPWLVKFSWTLALGPRLFEGHVRRVGPYRVRFYGLRATDTQLEWYWADAEKVWSKSTDGPTWAFRWEAIHGKPTVTITDSRAFYGPYDHPAGYGYPASTHEIHVQITETTTTWPRFWKQPRVTHKAVVRLDNPPRHNCQDRKAPTPMDEGIFDVTYNNVSTVEEAIQQYVSHVSLRRYNEHLVQRAP